MESDDRDPGLLPTISATPRDTPTAATDVERAATTPSPRDLAITLVIGERLGGRYLVTAFLGEGGMGSVYRAVDEKLGEEVALKVVRGLGIDDTLRDEVRLAQKVTHPNVCRTYDLEDAGGYQFVKMEYVAGETLATRLHRDGKLAVDETLRIARQIADGLAAAHAKGIVHRDLKPGNIMLAGDRAVLMDFGIARLVASPVEGLAGTVGYMAPEQITESAVDERADLYALGCVIYEMLAGEPVFGPARRLDLAVRHVSTRAPDLRGKRPDAPRWLASAIRDLLAKIPERREAGLARLRAGPRSPAKALAVLGAAAVLVTAVVGWRVLRAPTWRPHVVAFAPYDENATTTSIAPDGQWLVFDSDRAKREVWRLYVMERETGHTTQLATPPDKNVYAPRWSHDGTAILYEAADPGGDHIYLQPVAGSPPAASGSPVDLGTGTFPDACGSDAIVYVDSGPTARRVMLRMNDGSHHELATAAPGEDVSLPRCDPSGAQVVFVGGHASTGTGPFDVYVTDRAGHTRQLTSDHAASSAMFTADGRSIVFSALRDGARDLFVMPAKGGVARSLGVGDAGLAADVSRDGRRLVFHREELSTFPAISDGGAPRLITSLRGVYYWVRPVGMDRIVARRASGASSEIVTMRVSDGAITVLAAGFAPFPALDGKHVFFTSPGAPNVLRMIPIEGGTTTTVATLPGAIRLGIDGPDGQHLSIEMAPNVTEAFRVVAGRVEREGVAGIVSVAPTGGWRAVTALFDKTGAQARSRLQLIPPGASLTAPSQELESGSVINLWLDDHRIGYCVRGGCRVLDVTTGTTTEIPAWPAFNEHLAVVAPDGAHVYDSLDVGRVTRHMLANFDERP